jgi:S-adenosylmethionine:tRNA ribosyltransferase-isomerase
MTVPAATTGPSATGPSATGPSATGPSATGLSAGVPTLDFDLPAELEAREPPEARSGHREDVSLLVSRRAAGQISHHAFTDLPGLLLPGDLVVVNTSGTLPAAVAAGEGLVVHFSTAMPDGGWLVELRAARGPATVPYAGGVPGQVIELPGGARLTLASRFSARLWRARLSAAVLPYLLRHGRPIRYSYVSQGWPASTYQTVFATAPGSAEMPSASRPFSTAIVTQLVSRGVAIAPLTLHAGVSSLEGDEDPYPEFFEVPPSTARQVNLTRQAGGRVIAAGTTVVRALETAARRGSSAGEGVWPATGWTEHIVTPATGVSVVDGLLTGLHEPKSSHLWMLAAFAGTDLLARCYAAALERRYLWHEFGDTHLLLP